MVVYIDLQQNDPVQGKGCSAWLRKSDKGRGLLSLLTACSAMNIIIIIIIIIALQNTQEERKWDGSDI